MLAMNPTAFVSQSELDVESLANLMTSTHEQRRLENWLMADITSLSPSPGVFSDRSRVEQAIPAGNADGIDSALDILQRACGPRSRYQKIDGAKAICAHLDPGRAALNSRSFRRFLRVLGDSRYADQSRLPNPDV